MSMKLLMLNCMVLSTSMSSRARVRASANNNAFANKSHTH